MDKINVDILKKKKKDSLLFLKDKVHNQVTSMFYKTDNTLFMINAGSSMFRYLIKYEIFNDVTKIKIILTDKGILYTSSLIDVLDYLIKEKKFKKNQIIIFCNKDMDISPILHFYEIDKDFLIIWNINKEVKITDSSLYIQFMDLEDISFLLILANKKKYIICFQFVDINRFISILNNHEIFYDELLIHYFSKELTSTNLLNGENVEKIYLSIPDEFKEKISFLTVPNYLNNFHIFKLKTAGFKIIENIND